MQSTMDVIMFLRGDMTASAVNIEMARVCFGRMLELRRCVLGVW